MWRKLPTLLLTLVIPAVSACSPEVPDDSPRAARQALYALKPEFCSVTYGAGGSTQEGTFNTVGEILAEGVAAASHFSCIGATRDSIRALLQRFAREGRTVFVSSHLLAEVEQMCTHVAVMSVGSLVAQGTLDELRRVVGRPRLGEAPRLGRQQVQHVGADQVVVHHRVGLRRGLRPRLS